MTWLLKENTTELQGKKSSVVHMVHLTSPVKIHPAGKKINHCPQT